MALPPFLKERSRATPGRGICQIYPKHTQRWDLISVLSSVEWDLISVLPSVEWDLISVMSSAEWDLISVLPSVEWDQISDLPSVEYTTEQPPHLWNGMGWAV